MAGRLLIGQGHTVTLHARDTARAGHARAVLPAAENVLVGDLGSLDGIRSVATQAGAAGRFDAVIHNAGVGYREPRRDRRRPVPAVHGQCARALPADRVDAAA
ncbi:hypothetical protein AB0H92_27420 [Streptomyces phaeochromogenes]|uniref:hypothetical protein n=1 Tax=Streptomyces phaeochromogenes TaxID=1923 RepID=UPI0033CA425D